MRALACGALLAMLSTPVFADITPLLKSNRLSVAISAIKYPESLPKDLRSGLTNRFLVRVSLLADSQSLARKAIEISVKYDLWDEKYQVIVRIDDIVSTTNTYSNENDVIAMLGILKLVDLFETTELARRQELKLTAEMLVNPIERERMDKIRKWVADNSTYTPLGSVGFGAGRSAAASRSNELFNKIFEQYSAGAEMAAGWRQSETSKPFRLQDLVDEK